MRKESAAAAVEARGRRARAGWGVLMRERGGGVTFRGPQSDLPAFSGLWRWWEQWGCARVAWRVSSTHADCHMRRWPLWLAGCHSHRLPSARPVKVSLPEEAELTVGRDGVGPGMPRSTVRASCFEMEGWGGGERERARWRHF